jgi:hypothetical protein
MATEQEILAAYSRLSTRIIRGSGNRLASVFTNLGSWRDEDFEKFFEIASTTMTGAALQAARLQIAFYQQMAKLKGQPFIVPQLRPEEFTTQALRNGVAPREVYRRPFVDVYRALNDGKPLTEAVQLGANRISSIASTDIQLARRNAGFGVRSKNGGIVGFARTLTGTENCALCYVASTQRYTRGDLLPIHPGCDCGEMPIYGNEDPGQVIDSLRLEATHEAVEARFGRFDRSARELDYRQIAIQEHGELGPLLTVAGQDFTGPGDF